MTGYKLLRQRRNGTLGPLFINRRQIISVGPWLESECHPTKGYQIRPGWHILAEPVAPHLSTLNRVWCLVEFDDYQVLNRPAQQGGKWFLAKRMRVVEVL